MCPANDTDALIHEICCSHSTANARPQRRSQRARQSKVAPDLGRLLLLSPPPSESLPTLHGFFTQVVGEVGTYRFLAVPDLFEALSSEFPADLLIGCAVDNETKNLTLVRGDFTRVTLPIDFFTSFPSAERPTFDDVEVIDCGQTVRLGKHEASTDAVLCPRMSLQHTKWPFASRGRSGRCSRPLVQHWRSQCHPEQSPNRARLFRRLARGLGGAHPTATPAGIFSATAASASFRNARKSSLPVPRIGIASTL